MSTVAEDLQGLEVDDVHVGTQRWRVATRLPMSDPRPPLVLCNGIGANWQVFAPLLARLDDRPLVAFDVPGVGASPPPAGPYRLRTLASDLLAVLDQLGVSVFDVLGVSWGGALAQQSAIDSPARCRRMVLAATSPGLGSLPGRWSALRRLADSRRFGDAGHAARVLPKVYGGQLRSNPELLRNFLQSLRPPTRRGYAMQMLSLVGWSSLWWLPLLRQPTLILAGTDDPLVPRTNARILHGLIRRSELQWVDDGHLFLHTRAAEMAPRIAAFLDR